MQTKMYGHVSIIAYNVATVSEGKDKANKIV